jgi:hypothetical protein
VGFGLVFIVAMAVATIQGSKPFFSDSGFYWELSETFDKNGAFSFLNYHYYGFRGYSVPLTLYVLRELSHFGIGPGAEVALLNSALVALITAWLGPKLAEIAWPERRWGLRRRLLLGAIFLVFWRGYLNFPLTDLPALTAALLALVAIARFDSPLWLGVAGVSAAYAFNARPAYLLLIPLLALLLIWSWWRGTGDPARRTLRWRALGGAAFVLGLTLVSVPQSVLQHEWDDGITPVPGGTGLAGLQYTEGLRLQRYETLALLHHNPRMEYLDPDTDSIVAGLPGGAVSGTPEYLEIIASNPVTMAGLFLRHVVNGLDERYSTPYVEDVHPPLGFLLRLGGFVLVFLALLRAAWPRGRRSLGPARWRYMVVLLLCSATSVPSAIETRFMLPVFVLAGLLVLAPGWPSPIEAEAVGLRRYRTIAIAGLALVACFLVALSVVTGATHNLRLE